MTLHAQTIGQKIFELIRDSQAINVLANAQYSKDQSVYYRSTGDAKSPPSTDYPVFVIAEPRETRDEGADFVTYDFTIGVGVSDSRATTATTTTPYAGVKTVIYTGPSICKQLMDLVISELMAAYPQFLYVSIDEEMESIMFFPVIVGTVSLTLAIPQVMGGVEPSL